MRTNELKHNNDDDEVHKQFFLFKHCIYPNSTSETLEEEKLSAIFDQI